MGIKKSNETLVMQCEVEELCPSQVNFYNKAEEQAELFKRRIEQISKQPNTYIEKTSDITFVEFMGMSAHFMQPVGVPPLSAKPKPTSSLIIQNAPKEASTPHLIIDSTVTNMNSKTPPTSSTAGSPRSNTVRITHPTPTQQPSRSPGLRGPSPKNVGFRLSSPGIVKSRVTVPATPRTPGPASQQKVRQQTPSGSKSNAKPTQAVGPPPKKQKVSTAAEIVDLTDEDPYEDMPPSKADSWEVTFRNSEKTFPSLVVMARAHLSVRDFPNQQISQERVTLDSKVKQLLMLSVQQFIEWLLQHGLLRSEHPCPNADLYPESTHVPLKLGMYTDSNKFPFSGGYVWISECCPSQFISVFSGSIFEATPNPPATIMKLIYHWACQTGIQNVVSWVRVDNLYVKTLYTNLRAVCTAAIHQKFGMFGGPDKVVQVGVISLGTSTHDGGSKTVKVEILGVYDETKKYMRIRAIEPALNSDHETDPVVMSKNRFKRTLECLPLWVHKSSHLIIDHTVDRTALIALGFTRVTNASAPGAFKGEYQIMDYLRKIIPRMFQNTLSLLSRQIIQQFLDELVWREAFGPIPSRAFDSIIEHIGEQSRLSTGGTLMNRLSRISMNPFKNWSYDKWAHNCKAPVAPKVAQPIQSQSSEGQSVSVKKISASPPRKIPSSVKLNAEVKRAAPAPISSSSLSVSIGPAIAPAMIALEPYYYGYIEGKESCQLSYPFSSRCAVCNLEFKSASKLTDHLVLHALNKNFESPDAKDICKICLKVWPPGNRQHHQQLCQQQRVLPGPECKICNLKLRDKGSLVYHMTKVHHQLDMPYHCEVCGFRASELEMVTNHYTKVHRNSSLGVCPFCLKMVRFATVDGKDLVHNQIFLIKHLQRHVLPTSKKCSRCLLNFVNAAVLANHEMVMHASCSSFEEVNRINVKEPTLMPAPIMEPMTVHALRAKNASSFLKGIGSVVYQHIIPTCSEKFLCHECESPITLDHFRNIALCAKCPYKTCCVNAMAEHASLIHPPYPLSSSVFLGVKVKLQESFSCNACPFTTDDGNLMSNHLLTCKIGSYCLPAVVRSKMICAAGFSEDSSSSYET